MTNKKHNPHKGHRERMRERFRKVGFDGFLDHEILEILLYYSIKRTDTNEIAHRILDKYKTLANVFDAPVEELMRECDISEVSATLLSMVPKLSKVYETSRWAKKVCLPDTEALGGYIVPIFKDKLHEEIALVCLDGNRCVNWGGIIIKGDVDEIGVYPRVVIKEALRHNATHIVIAHNHPGGTLAPSIADKQATDELVKILKCIGVNVLDHIIVSANGYFSMREMGFFD